MSRSRCVDCSWTARRFTGSLTKQRRTRQKQALQPKRNPATQTKILNIAFAQFLLNRELTVGHLWSYCCGRMPAVAPLQSEHVPSYIGRCSSTSLVGHLQSYCCGRTLTWSCTLVGEHLFDSPRCVQWLTLVTSRNSGIQFYCRLTFCAASHLACDWQNHLKRWD